MSYRVQTVYNELLCLHSLQNLMAKALYDNVPESPEELAFRKGDILTVIEQNTGGLEGWWLCSLHGRQGIAPGNRLKLLIGPMFEGQTSASPSPPQGHALQQMPLTPQGVYQVPLSHQSPQGQGIYQIPPSKDVYQVPQRSALAADGTPCKVNSTRLDSSLQDNTCGECAADFDKIKRSSAEQHLVFDCVACFCSCVF